MTEVRLYPEVLRGLLAIARRRNDQKTAAQSRRRSTAYSDVGLDYLGVKGEYVAAMVYGVPWDTQGYGAAGDQGVDLWTPEAGAVKTNHRRGGFLLIERWSDVARVDRLHLVDGPCDPPRACSCQTLTPTEPETWRYIGWITVEAFRAQAEEANWGLGPRWFCRQATLTPLSSSKGA